MAMLQWLREGFHQPLSLLLPFIFFLILINLLLQLHNSRKHRSHNHLPPSPPSIPIIGNLHQLGNMPHLSLQHLASKYGPIIFLQLGEIPTIVVSSAKLAEQVLKTHDLALASRPQLFAAKHLFYNSTNIVFSPYGPYWRNVRKICILELFSAKRVDLYQSIREQEVARLVSRISKEYSSGNSMDLSRFLGLYANDVLCRTVFGREFSEGGDSDYSRHGFQKMLEEYQVLLGGFSVGEFFPSLEFMHSLTGFKSRLKDTFRRFDQLFDQILKEHACSKEIVEHRKDLVDVLLEVQRNSHSDDEMPLTTDNIKAIILDMFAAGTDTTFITLDWAMTELMINPAAMKKAQNEVRGVLGERRVVLETDLQNLHYIKAIIKETFRFHSPVPLLVPRESMEEVTIENYRIPPKTRVYVNAWAIGRDKESWEDAEIFKPERFLGRDKDIDFKGRDFELIPFGAGRRGCPAMTFGIAVIELALAQLLYSFDWELPSGISAKDLDLTEVFGISMHRRDHLYVVAKPHFAMKD